MAYATLGITLKTDAIRNDPCYFGLISREEAEKYLKERATCKGTYLVREGEDGYRLSVIEYRKGGRSAVVHYKIELLFNKTYCIDPRISFPSIVSLVAYYGDATNQTNMLQPLTMPCPKQRPVPTSEVMPVCHPVDIVNLKKIRKDLIFPMSQIARGTFSNIWKGTVASDSKMILKVQAKEKHYGTYLLQEACIIHKFSHENIVQLHGVCSEDPICLITKFHENQDLLNYILRNDIYEISSKERLRFAQEVTSALQYISIENYVHRNIQAANVLLTSSLVCKLSGFGYARELDENGVYTQTEDDKPLGAHMIRWMSLEATEFGRFSKASDVWALACLFQELLSDGEAPFAGTFTDEVLTKVKAGYRSPAPKNTFNALYSLMLKCWASEPMKRPDPEEIQDILTELRERPSIPPPSPPPPPPLPLRRVTSSPLLLGKKLSSTQDDDPPPEERSVYLEMKPMLNKSKKQGLQAFKA